MSAPLAGVKMINLARPTNGPSELGADCEAILRELGLENLIVFGPAQR